MPRILAVHGIGQQYKADEVIREEWWPYLAGGLHNVNVDIVKEDLVCPFYGHLFRKHDLLSGDDKYAPKDLTEEELALLEVLLEEAAIQEPGKVDAKTAFDQQHLGTPQWAQWAVSMLSRSKFFVNISQHMMMGDLKQVVRYMNDNETREAVIEKVMNKFTDDVKIVIGHSLGSVVAYECLFRKPAQEVCFITMGSPLGIRNLIFDKLRPSPEKGKGRWPPVKNWTNIADKGDLVALNKYLSSLFGPDVTDIIVDNGAQAHNGTHYLSSSAIAKTIAANL